MRYYLIMEHTKIITHRGLDPAKLDYYPESSLEAFGDQLTRGYGLEFDIQLAKDGVMVAVHDETLNRLTEGQDKREIKDISSPEILGMSFRGGHLTTIANLLALIAQSQSPETLSALHLKASWQEFRFVDLLLEEIKASGIGREQFIIFDLKPETAKKIKEQIPELLLAASVAHPYDIERYNPAAGGTLLGLEEVFACRDLFSWAWLDEWDLVSKTGDKKQLYTPEVFNALKSAGIKAAVVSPELHAKSPGLLAGEVHEDGADPQRLKARIQEILRLEPDAICTDYPDEVREAQAAAQKALG